MAADAQNFTQGRRRSRTIFERPLSETWRRYYADALIKAAQDLHWAIRYDAWSSDQSRTNAEKRARARIAWCLAHLARRPRRDDR
jgi:hypothetical protein